MRIPLHEFEQIIDQTILQRGLSYFKKGCVCELTEIAPGEYEAIVLGSEEYTIQLEIGNNIITEHNCNCPYDMGPVCKHIVAVIFYLQQDVLELHQKSPAKTKRKATAKTKSVTQQVNDILKALPDEELKDFVQNTCKNDRKFRNYFLASFGHLSEDQTKSCYQKQIKSILKTAAGRDGFIYWSDMKYMVQSIDPFLNNAEKYIENHSYRNAIYISTALLEEMTGALQYGDDSSGDIGGIIHFVMEMLYKIASGDLPVAIRKELFNYCIDAFQKGLFSGWDWHLDMLEIACKVVEDEKDVDKLLHCLDTVHGEYEREQAQHFKLEVIRKFKGSSEALKFIDQNINNYRIRREEIANALQNKNYESAIKLSKDGIVQDQKDKPGLAKEWYDWLLKIAQAQNDTSKIVEYARFLFIENFNPQQDYYQVLKNNIEENNWHSFVEEMIKDIKTNHKRGWVNTGLIRNIYIKEQWWDRLFSLLKQNVSLHSLERDEKYLSKDYAPEFVKLYSENIIQYLQHNVGRKHYQTVCRYLRRMKKLGGGTQVTLLIENFRKEYPQRRALMDELSQV